MRDNYPRTGRSALVWIISASIAAFIMTNVCERLFLTEHFTSLFSLSIWGIKHGYIWQLLTYGFMHPPGEPFDVLVCCFNLLCLYLLGRELESLLGTKRFVWLYVAGIVLGGIAWSAVNFRFGGIVMTAWPGIIALFTLYTCLNADQRIPLLIFFVFPVTLKPKYIAWAAFAFDLCGLLLYELPHGHSPFGYHSHHLGGMLAGVLYYRLVHEREWRTPDGLTELEMPKWLKKKQKIEAAAQAALPFKSSQYDRDGIRIEVDRILDKINSEGFAALTEEEKRILDEAKDLLSRR